MTTTSTNQPQERMFVFNTVKAFINEKVTCSFFNKNGKGLLVQELKWGMLKLSKLSITYITHTVNVGGVNKLALGDVHQPDHAQNRQWTS